MTVFLPRDAHGHPVPAVRLKPGGAHTIAVTAASARNATAFNAGTRLVSLFATGPIFVRFGGADVAAAATDHYYPGGLYYDFAIGGDGPAHMTHIAAIRAGDSNATLYISEKE